MYKSLGLAPSSCRVPVACRAAPPCVPDPCSAGQMLQERSHDFVVENFQLSSAGSGRRNRSAVS